MASRIQTADSTGNDKPLSLLIGPKLTLGQSAAVPQATAAPIFDDSP